MSKKPLGNEFMQRLLNAVPMDELKQARSEVHVLRAHRDMLGQMLLALCDACTDKERQNPAVLSSAVHDELIEALDLLARLGFVKEVPNEEE